MHPTTTATAQPSTAAGRGALDDVAAMALALSCAAQQRTQTSPNPWVGAVVLGRDGAVVSTGATQPPGGPHAEVVALRSAGAAARGGTLVVTLEPCSHTGRTPPCVDAVVAAGIARVVVGTADPDGQVSGRGIAALRAAGVRVDVLDAGAAAPVRAQLAPYLHHRSTGRPYVVLKLAATLDGRIAAPDGTSQWITGEEARRDAHLLRAESDAIVVGAGTVRADDPALTVRHVPGRDPRRIVLGCAPEGARVRPCEEHRGALEPLLERLGTEGVLQVLVEGGAAVAGAFHDAGLVDRYVVYLAPTLMGGEGAPMLRGRGITTMTELRRGSFSATRLLGADLRIDLEVDRTAATTAPSPDDVRDDTRSVH